MAPWRRARHAPASIGLVHLPRLGARVFRLFSIALAAAILAGQSLSASPAQAESVAAGEPLAADKGAKTLLEPLLGRGKTEKDESGEEDRLDPDRPHFPEASTTVGNGRAILESGYTFTKKDASFVSHSLPEALLRVGMFADWFEFRIGQNFIDERQTVAGATTSMSGAQDLYLGVKLALTEQKGLLPAIALIPQMTVPTGSRTATAGTVLPGLNVDASWEVIKNLFSIELLVANNRVKDELGGTRHELATGLTGAFQITRQLEAFAEWDAFYPHGGIGPAGPRHYAVAGLVYFITPNIEVDVRTGVGLNRNANDFLVGVGFAKRY
jgi:Putative MetA-pathway of phenol degradation